MSKKAANIVAFPSLSSSLNALPHATSMAHVPLHHGMYAQGKESEAKLQKALQMNLQNGSQQNAYPAPLQSQSQPGAAALMMRKPNKK